MKYFIDTEFYERGRGYPIELISIGIVREDGEEFYAENLACDLADLSDWLKENVVPQLTEPKMLPTQIAEGIRKFIGDDSPPEFWGYYADYDWVVFCQLFGSMIKLPAKWPMYCRDLKQWCDMLGNPRLPKSTFHHALSDARWNRQIYQFLSTYKQSQTS